jgi:hypothetical protein
MVSLLSPSVGESIPSLSASFCLLPGANAVQAVQQYEDTLAAVNSQCFQLEVQCAALQEERAQLSSRVRLA